MKITLVTEQSSWGRVILRNDRVKDVLEEMFPASYFSLNSVRFTELGTRQHPTEGRTLVGCA